MPSRPLHLRVKEIYIFFQNLLKKNNIRPLVVFDGLPIKSKEGVRVKRAIKVRKSIACDLNCCKKGTFFSCLTEKQKCSHRLY